MTQPLWRLDAVELAARIRRKDVSCVEATQSVLDRIAAVDPSVNALPLKYPEEALAAARAADQQLARGEPVGELHGVPVSIKVNVDVAGQPTDGGIVALKDLMATQDAPLVRHLKNAGAVIVGRNNVPSFSLRWFSDNDLHGRTLNPWDAQRTPGGSSGGAAAAAALGMGPIHHGNDYGGSIRYPAFACGVVGMRPTAGRIAAVNATAKEDRILSNQQMSVQGPLTRSVADARLALKVMSQEDPRDPLWVPAPLEYPSRKEPLKVALFKRWSGCDTHPTVRAALEQAAQWLADAGCVVEEQEPPHFEEATVLWRQLVHDDMRRSMKPAIDALGDRAVRTAVRGYFGSIPDWSRDQYLTAQQRRLTIARAWSLFYAQYPVLLMPVSWERQFPIDEDQRGQERLEQMLAAQSPLLATAMLGLPGLSVPTGVADGLPTGVQLCATRYREDLCLAAGEIVERAARFRPLDHLAG
ncbi:amidase family protein [Ramlibacter tataouinensis]|uniref:amidase family protein n=1 Tax=Ramlibacter tataouinensis TaxID=94132 RepID=UPI0022F3A42C|nr:amidase family protein [Ramlibacter tataouinensis]WBY01222.1 amidase family protein [Ramlibacter tataouinensis]